MIYLALFILLVLAIAVVTHRLNAKTPCDHTWEKHDGGIKCCKCGRKIPEHVTVNEDAFTEAA
jgi:hypothetical protein